MRSVESLLVDANTLHGHVCPGQILGVKMAMLGCGLIGVEEPTLSRDLVVYAEIDRCATDAIQAVTGCKLGKRALKYQDYGKVAATFVNLDSGEAVRVVAREDSRDRAWLYAPVGADPRDAQKRAYRTMPDAELFDVMRVLVDVPEWDMPGHPTSRVICESCGEGVNDRREVVMGGRTLCVPCAHGAYYVRLDVAAEPIPQPASSN